MPLVILVSVQCLWFVDLSVNPNPTVSERNFTNCWAIKFFECRTHKKVVVQEEEAFKELLSFRK